MKTKLFKLYLSEKFGVVVTESKKWLTVSKGFDRIDIHKERMYTLDTTDAHEISVDLFAACLIYAMTPIEDRC